jgi:hypothetical protein
MSIIIELLASLLPYGVTQIWNYVSRDRHFDKFWGEFTEDLLIVLPFRNPSPEARYSPTLVGLMEFSNRLREIKAIDVTSSDNLSFSEQRRNILAVGGPITNLVTKNILQHDSIFYSFEGHAIVRVNEPDWRLDPTPKSGMMIEKDYGLITRISNPYDKSKDVICLAGCYGWGVQACLRLLSDVDSIKYLNSATRYFQVICSCDIDKNDYAMLPYIMDIHPESTKQLDTFRTIIT